MSFLSLTNWHTCTHMNQLTIKTVFFSSCEWYQIWCNKNYTELQNRPWIAQIKSWIHISVSPVIIIHNYELASAINGGLPTFSPSQNINSLKRTVLSFVSETAIGLQNQVTTHMYTSFLQYYTCTTSFLQYYKFVWTSANHINSYSSESEYSFY